ncbi:conidiation protein 6 [Phanerochaete sordida]|uniref:Conidiation protein 6 n=1 Tax=Phanerochaete sordida TaxID=48140 RepID=A0A9P3FZC4_9APHY|nr:conidiation protein 6 [Phanerochaete sordida]
MSANVGNVARGLKAAVSNPKNSEEAKDRAQQRLDEMESSGEAHSEDAKMAQVKQGHKANLNNPNTSEESKQHSKQVLDQE